MGKIPREKTEEHVEDPKAGGTANCLKADICGWRAEIMV